MPLLIPITIEVTGLVESLSTLTDEVSRLRGVLEEQTAILRQIREDHSDEAVGLRITTLGPAREQLLTGGV